MVDSEGLKRAAEWHKAQAKQIADRLNERRMGDKYAQDWSGLLKAEWHQESAKALLGLIGQDSAHTKWPGEGCMPGEDEDTPTLREALAAVDECAVDEDDAPCRVVIAALHDLVRKGQGKDEP